MTRLVFDIGGTHLRLALTDGGSLGAVHKVDTPKSPEEGAEAIRAFLETQDTRADDAAGGIAGVLQNGTVVDSPNLPSWNGFDFASALRDRCGIASVHVLNDAEAAGIGEAVTGAGKGYRAVGFVTVSTGIGGSLIIDGKPAPHGAGHEPGRQIIDYEKLRSLADMASGAGLVKEFGAAPERLPHENVLERIRPLAVGLYNIIRIWSPDILVLGGSLMNDETGYPLDTLVQELSDLPIVLPSLPPIVRGTLGDEAGLTGAAVLRKA